MAETHAIIDALATNLGESLGTMTGMAARTMPTVGDASVDWQVPVQVGGNVLGTVFLGLSQEAATALVASILGDASLVADADIVDTLRELLAQAAATFVNGAAPGLTLTVEQPVPVSAAVPAETRLFDLIVGTAEPIRLVGCGSTITGLPASSRQAPALASPVMPASVDAAPPPRNLDVVLDIELPITVRFGETQMTLESLARLGPGSMIDLERSPEDPVDLLVNGRLVARGQVVVVSGCYGIRISEVVSPADRLRSLEL